MNPENQRLDEEELSNRLWRAITALQAMTDRLLTQYEKTLRGQGANAESLTSRAV